MCQTVPLVDGDSAPRRAWRLNVHQTQMNLLACEPMLCTLAVSAVTATGENIAGNFVQHFVRKVPPLERKIAATLWCCGVVWKFGLRRNGRELPIRAKMRSAPALATARARDFLNGFFPTKLCAIWHARAESARWWKFPRVGKAYHKLTVIATPAGLNCCLTGCRCIAASCPTMVM